MVKSTASIDVANAKNAQITCEMFEAGEAERKFYAMEALRKNPPAENACFSQDRGNKEKPDDFVLSVTGGRNIGKTGR